MSTHDEEIYKLTDCDGYTQRGKPNQTLWGENVSNTATGKGGLCTDGLIHAYEHPLLASLMNPAHENLSNPILWKAKGKIVEREWQLKCGVKTLTTIRRIDLPKITVTQRVAIGIKCALLLYRYTEFAEWAEDWLNNVDRSGGSAQLAWDCADGLVASPALRRATSPADWWAAMSADWWAAMSAVAAAAGVGVDAEAEACLAVALAVFPERAAGVQERAACPAAEIPLLDIIREVISDGRFAREAK